MTARFVLVAASLLLVVGCSAEQGDEGAGSTTTMPSASTTAAPQGTLTPLQDVAVGQCFDEVADEGAQPFAVASLRCEDPHTFEAYLRADLQSAAASGKGAPYPGELTVANAAEEQCAASFEAFMGLSWEASDYEIRSWWPMQQAWEGGDRSILCAVYRVTGGTTIGSARGTAQ